MNKILDFDNMIRKIISVFYRGILTLYCCLILISNINFFNFTTYSIVVVIYLGLSFFLITKKGSYLKMRLGLDYSLISIVLYQKQIESLPCIILLLLPIFNTPNFSGKKRSYFILYSLPFTIFFLLTKKHFQFIIPISFFSLFCISYLEYLRSRSFNFYYSLTNSISEFYGTRRQSGREYKIYDSIIQKFNKNAFSRICSVDNIHCLQITEHLYSIRNSSTVVFDIEINELDTFKKKVQVNELFSDSKILVDGVLLKFNLAIPVKRDKDYLVYLIDGRPSKNILNAIPFIRDKFFLTPFLIPFFTQLSHFFETEEHYRRNRIRKFSKVKGEYEYVLRTINAVHFIRNRLSPFKNYLEMTSDLYTPANYSEIKRKQLEEIVVEENERSQKTLKEILYRVKQILEEGDNPFNVTKDIIQIELRALLSEIQGILLEIMGGNNISQQFDIEDLKKKTLLSSKGFSIIISDIIGNIKKHSNGIYKVSFIVENDNLIIKFNNKFNADASKNQKLKELEHYFASEDNYNIFKMSSKGAFLIKDFSKQMEIKVTASVNESESIYNIELLLKLMQ